MNSIHLAVISDASFAHLRGFGSQMGFLVLMVDKEDNADVVRYGWERCRLVTRSLIADKLRASILEFYFELFIKAMLTEVLKPEVAQQPS